MAESEGAIERHGATDQNFEKGKKAKASGRLRSSKTCVLKFTAGCPHGGAASGRAA